MTEILTAVAVGASFVYASGKLKAKLFNMAARRNERSGDEK